LNIEEHQKIIKLQKKRLKVHTDDLFTFASDDVLPGKHSQTAY